MTMGGGEPWIAVVYIRAGGRGAEGRRGRARGPPRPSPHPHRAVIAPTEKLAQTNSKFQKKKISLRFRLLRMKRGKKRESNTTSAKRHNPHTKRPPPRVALHTRGPMTPSTMLVSPRLRAAVAFIVVVTILSAAFAHAATLNETLAGFDFDGTPDAIASPSPAPRTTRVRSGGRVRISEVLFHDRAGGWDWIELVNEADDETDLADVIIQIDDATLMTAVDLGAAACNLTQPLAPHARLLVFQAGATPEDVATLLEPEAKDPCHDRRPGKFACAQEREWGKCAESFMLEGDFCAMTCGRCLPRPPQPIRNTAQLTVAPPGCRFSHDLGPNGSIAILRLGEGGGRGRAVEDRVRWRVQDTRAGIFSVGRPASNGVLDDGERRGERGEEGEGGDGGEGGALLISLADPTPGRPNTAALESGPLGPFFPGTNPFLPSPPHQLKSKRETQKSGWEREGEREGERGGGASSMLPTSDIPIAIIRPSRGFVPQDPKDLATLWMSGCAIDREGEEEGRGEGPFRVRGTGPPPTHTPFPLAKSGSESVGGNVDGPSLLSPPSSPSSPSSSSSTKRVSRAVWNVKGVVCSVDDLKAAYVGPAGIELRGRSSQRYPKKQYGLELWKGGGEEGEGVEVSLAGMPEHEDWILGAPYVDRSLMRDVLAFDMAIAMGHWAPRTTFIERE